MVLEHYQDSDQAQLIRLFHTVTYRFAQTFTAGKDVLDYGCGSGYGSATIARDARSVKAVDVAADAIAYAGAHHAHDNLEYRTIDPEGPLPFPDASFDVVLSFQVIEHVPQPHAYLREVVRVLRPRGVLVLATPDRRTRLFPLQRPWNRYHLTEYSQRSLGRLLSAHFAEVDQLTMGGEETVLAIELHRTRRLKWLSLPFTLPVIPNSVRVGALDAIQVCKRTLAPLRGRGAPRPRPPRTLEERDLAIGKGLWPSVNLVAVARRN